MGERLTVLAEPRALRAATAVMLLCPQVPLLFMGEEEGSTTPFLFFTDFHDELADAVREGRRREFAKFPEFSDPAMRARIPDPNASETFERSRPKPGPDAGAARTFYAELLALRHRHIVPRLRGAMGDAAEVIGDKAIRARWRMADGARLTVALNLDREEAPLADAPPVAPIYATDRVEGRLPPFSFAAWLEPAR
jgi:maltooligosyltrehalose trehalohydrolase